MYSILMSNFQTGFYYIKNHLNKLITKDNKIVVIPWSFPIELDSKDVREFFDDNKYNTYIQSKEDVENVTIADDMDLSFKFLPRAFDVTNLDLSLMDSYDLKDCFLYTTTLPLSHSSNYFWLSDPNLQTTNMKISTRNTKVLKSVTKAYTFYENTDFKYAYISDSFEQKVDELYKAKLETINNATRN